MQGYAKLPAKLMIAYFVLKRKIVVIIRNRRMRPFSRVTFQMPTLVSLTALLAKMTAIFAKADPDQIADLNDSLDISNGKVVQDLWTGGRPPAPDVGPNQAMAGGRAADKFVADYSSPTSNNESPTALLGKLVSRMDSMDGVLKAIMQHVFLKSDADEDGDKSEEDDAAAKSDTKPDGEGDRFPGNADAAGAARKATDIPSMSLNNEAFDQNFKAATRPARQPSSRRSKHAPCLTATSAARP